MNEVFYNLGHSIESLIADISNKKDVSVFLLNFSKKTIVASRVAELGTVVYVCSDYYHASNVYSQLKSINDDVAYLPHRDDVLTYKYHSKTNDYNRIAALNRIKNGANMVVTTINALTQSVMHISTLKANCIVLSIGLDYVLSELSNRLSAVGYVKSGLIEYRGQYSIRGDIVDIWPPNSEPLRIEFFGDTIETIKYFDSVTRTSKEAIDYIELIPCSEWIVSHKDRQDYINMLRAYDSNIAKNIIAELECNRVDSGMSVLWGIDGRGSQSLQDFVRATTTNDIFVIYDDCKKISDNLNIITNEHNNRARMLLSSGEILPQFIKINQNLFEGGVKIAYHDSLTQNRIFNPLVLHNFKNSQFINYTYDYREFKKDILQWENFGHSVNLCIDDEYKRDTLDKWVGDNKLSHCVKILNIGLDYGAAFFECQKVLIGKYDLFKKSVQKKVQRSKQAVFTQPDIDDFVVHSVHGIGIYKGVEKLALSGPIRDYVVIRYRDNDTLYLPVENMDTLTKYVSAKTPALNKLGGAEFAKVKDRVLRSVKKLAVDLAQLYAQRADTKGYRYDKDDDLYQEFANQFEYEPTEDQVLAIKDILSDLQNGKVMDRLLCGDVGYGKTEVAMRACFRVVVEGHQVAFVSPTTILAKQHYNTIKKRMQDFGVNVVSLTRMDNAQQIKDTKLQIANGQADIIVGTHRVFGKDIIFKNLALLVLDEEQKFGVGDKEKIKNIKTNVNVLTLSATPIPRTLHMSLSGMRDISVLDTPPNNRIPIQTYVAEFTESLVVDAVNRELGRGGSVFIVYNKVEKMQHFVARLQGILPNAKIVYANGQMNMDILEDAIISFTDGVANVLVASTIIENGIDMPNANTIIVIDSDKLGLSQMYQLRGRVGRSNRQAYAYFTFDDGKILTETASKRLNAINEFTDLGSGYKLSMRDLEIRGAGTVLGREQHGHIENVGYDLYCKLLNQAVGIVNNGIDVMKDIEVKVVTDKPAYLPVEYIEDATSRLNFYSRISRLSNIEQREKLYQEIVDIYGKPPTPVANLLVVGLVKNLTLINNAHTVKLTQKECSITYDKIKDIPVTLKKSIELNKCEYRNAEKQQIIFSSVVDMIKLLSAK